MTWTRYRRCPELKVNTKQAQMSGDVVAKLHMVEKHIRKNKLQVINCCSSSTAWHTSVLCT